VPVCVLLDSVIPTSISYLCPLLGGDSVVRVWNIEDGKELATSPILCQGSIRKVQVSSFSASPTTTLLVLPDECDSLLPRLELDATGSFSLTDPLRCDDQIFDLQVFGECLAALGR
jgi:hypothetical protein